MWWHADLYVQLLLMALFNEAYGQELQGNKSHLALARDFTTGNTIIGLVK
jgi:hypothetical protein